MSRHNRIGKWGEQVAYDLLVSKGYAIRETNWRLYRYEIDIVAMHGNRIVFVEVKTRTNREDNPAEAVDRRRQSRMAIAAHNYVQINNLPHEVQFDIITVSGTPDDYAVEHIPDAFWPSVRTIR